MFQFLAEYRRELALSRGVPPYVIFSDATLQEISLDVPMDEDEFRDISGVGEQKWLQYGQLFIERIKVFLDSHPTFVMPEKAPREKKVYVPKERFVPAIPKEKFMPTHLQTLKLYTEGLGVEEIAAQRMFSVGTAYSHLLKCYEEGEEVNILNFVSQEECDKIAALIPSLPEPLRLKDIFDHFEGTISYEKIRMALAYQKSMIV